MSAIETYDKAVEFEYDDLPDPATYLRLLKLHRPSDKFFPVRAELVIVSVSTHPKYVALSYVWGAKTPLVVVLINDRLFPVRQNLYAFLWRYAQDGTQDLLWIDAICIYPDQHHTNCCRKSRVEPLFSEEFGFQIYDS